MSVTKLFDYKNSQAAPVADTLIKDFAAGGITFLDEQKFIDVVLKSTGKLSVADMEAALQSFYGCSIDLAVPEDYKTPPTFSVKVTNISTGRAVYFSDFSLHPVKGENVLNFQAHMFMPEAVTSGLGSSKASDVKYATTFLDLCYGGAGELQSDGTDCATPIREGAVYADIGWIMSSRFVDTLIDAMGKVNDSLFDGALRESIIYARTRNYGSQSS